ncbi:MAG: hypothetical protein L3K19_07965 [Thermoplasmata archaeon]|nr:hypothetical protein [Thermoplasmata archaeon]
MNRSASATLLLSLLVAGSLLISAPAAVAPRAHPADSTADGATLSITTSGLLALNLTFSDPNGSTLRYAMDGNFTPLVEGLPINASTQSRVLGQIATLESTPLVGGFFGNRDGSVSPGEVTLFEGLLHQLTAGTGGVLPTNTLSVASLANVTLDGARASVSAFQSVSFSGAEGPDSSELPLGISLQFSYQFGVSGTQHTLALSIGGAGLPSALVIPTALASVSFSTPGGTTITSVDGLSGVSTSTDPLGWGSSDASGTYTLSANSVIAFHYQTSFPTGDVLIGGAVTGLVAAAASLLLLRRRRRRKAASASGPKAEEGAVGPSGSA